MRQPRSNPKRRLQITRAGHLLKARWQGRSRFVFTKTVEDGLAKLNVFDPGRPDDSPYVRAQGAARRERVNLNQVEGAAL